MEGKRARQQIRGEKGGKKERWGREPEGKVPGRIFFEIFFFSFSFLMAEI